MKVQASMNIGLKGKGLSLMGGKAMIQAKEYGIGNHPAAVIDNIRSKLLKEDYKFELKLKGFDKFFGAWFSAKDPTGKKVLYVYRLFGDGVKSGLVAITCLGEDVIMNKCKNLYPFLNNISWDYKAKDITISIFKKKIVVPKGYRPFIVDQENNTVLYTLAMRTKIDPLDPVIQLVLANIQTTTKKFLKAYASEIKLKINSPILEGSDSSIAHSSGVIEKDQLKIICRKLFKNAFGCGTSGEQEFKSLKLSINNLEVIEMPTEKPTKPSPLK